MAEKITRRDFLRRSAIGVAGLTIVPSAVLGSKAGKKSPSDKLNIAGIGIGGKGAVNIRNMSGENIVALCDVDWDYAKKTFEEYPNAKRFWDYREMFDKMNKDIDAVVVVTPDHTHAIITADAMTLGKHVYCQKPLTHTVYESRLLAKLAEKYKVATQMGNEGASGEGFRYVADLIWNGELGEVTKVQAWTDRPIWPQGMNRPEPMTVPDTLRWDLFIGPAQMRPSNRIYQPWNWRGWWDFGTGALGDMACHILHPVYHALQLCAPTAIQASSTTLLSDSAPLAQHVKFKFPARGRKYNVALPECTIDWFDGGLKGDIPEGMPDDKRIDIGGTIYYGTKDTLVISGGEPFLLSGRTPKVPSRNRVIEVSHELDWIRACKESPENRVPCVSDFKDAGPVNEMVVSGVLAARLQPLGKELLWDGPNMRFTNLYPHDTIKQLVKGGYIVTEGDPKYSNIMSEPMSAQEFAQEMIKHTYQNGYKLVDMPK